ncbi:fimbriae Y protein [Salmonella enterica subsp. enterica]|uniref:Fimbriae Y protein n=1 Tax=Salmonella enterica I TaxID=59201 RepID=A0A447U7Y2_SALET|nr:fimbriae Y protein [Salmonella enterica subsp. enterica]
MWIEKGSLRQLIVDMETLPVSCIEALNQLRALSWQQSDIQFYLLVSDKTPAIAQFIRMAGRFFCPVATTKIWPLYAKPCYQPPNLAYRKALAVLTG